MMKGVIMAKRILSFFLALTIISAVPMSVSAEDIDDYTQPVITDEIQRTVGLISLAGASISTGTKKIHMNLETYAYTTMDEIGFTIIDIERSSDNVHFTHERYADDKTITNATHYHVGDYAWNVSGGYYYRVTLYHYASSGSTIETLPNTTNSVWVG